MLHSQRSRNGPSAPWQSRDSKNGLARMEQIAIKDTSAIGLVRFLLGKGNLHFPDANARPVFAPTRGVATAPLLQTRSEMGAEYCGSGFVNDISPRLWFYKMIIHSW